MKAAMITAKKPVNGTPPRVMLPPKASKTSAAPKLAPLFMPKMDGPANGLRNAVCSKSPLTASELPHRMAVMACGKRVCNMMYFHAPLQFALPNMMLKTSDTGMSTAPNIRFRANAGSKATAIIQLSFVPFVISIW